MNKWVYVQLPEPVNNLFAFYNKDEEHFLLLGENQTWACWEDFEEDFVSYFGKEEEDIELFMELDEVRTGAS